jgi:hypothetical protein
MDSWRRRQREASESPAADCTGRVTIKYFVGIATRGDGSSYGTGLPLLARSVGLDDDELGWLYIYVSAVL